MKRLCILLGSAHVGGGTYVVFQHALWLQEHGWEVVIVPHFPLEPGQLDWHPEAKAKLSFSRIEDVESSHFDVALATWWRTVYDLHKISANTYAYFVQSIESRFFPEWDSATRAFAEATYTFGLPVITEVSWIQEYLKKEHSTQSLVARNGIRKDLYTDDGEAVAERNARSFRVLVEGPLKVFFKNTEQAIELSLKSRADEVWFMTSTKDLCEYPGVDRVFSCVAIDEAAAIYRSCHVLVKLSYVEGMFGPPLEMFHCGGTAVAYDVTGADEYMRDRMNSRILPRDDQEGVIQAVNDLRDDYNKWSEYRAQALLTAKEWPCWSSSSKLFGEHLSAIALSGAGPQRAVLENQSKWILKWFNDHKAQQDKLFDLIPKLEFQSERAMHAERRAEELTRSRPETVTSLRRYQALELVLLRKKIGQWLAKTH